MVVVHIYVYLPQGVNLNMLVMIHCICVCCYSRYVELNIHVLGELDFQVPVHTFMAAKASY